jgi:hypothetical protein
MTGQDDPLDSFKPSGAPPQPSEVEFREAEAQLLAAIDLEMTRSKRRSRAAGWRLPAIAATVAVALGLFAVLQPDPARAALLEVARAARLATPIDIPSGSYVYSRSENVHLVVRPGSDMNLNSESVAYPCRRFAKCGGVRLSVSFKSARPFNALLSSAQARPRLIGRLVLRGMMA